MRLRQFFKDRCRSGRQVAGWGYTMAVEAGMVANFSAQQISESVGAGRDLALSFQQGAAPAAVPVSVALEPGEICVGYTDVGMSEWLVGDGEYIHRSGGYVGLAGMAVFGAVNVIGNSQRKAAAARAAAPQWRAQDQGRLYMTSRRLAIQGEMRWTDIWFPSIRMSYCEPGAMILEITGSPRILLNLSRSYYWFVMFRKLAYDSIEMPPVPGSVAG